jgi:hypothetical protein
MRATLLAAASLALAGCDGSERRTPRAASSDTPTPSAAARCGGVGGGAAVRVVGASHPVHAIQVGAFSDSGRAELARDSLVREGWTAHVRTGGSGRARWRVLVAPTSNAELPSLFLHALRQGGREALVVKDSVSAEMATVGAIRVNQGTSGMLSRVRWTQPPDRCAIVVVDDPVGVENEAIPNGFLFATEVGPFLLQQDSVWDVAPSPSWARLAFGRAYVLSAREQDSVATTQWADVARRTGQSVDRVRQAAFPTSGMSIAFGVAQPVVVDVSPRVTATSASDRAARRVLPLLGGWRVAWTKSGDTLGVGSGPTHVQDDAPAPAWQLVALDGAPASSPTPAPADHPFAPVEWNEGPVLDISTPVDVSRPQAVSAGTYRIESRDGWIRITGPAPGGGSSVRIVGPGVVLAATAGGRFVAALAPRPRAREYEAKYEPVVYEVVE